jgi:hypothetical protein
MILASKYWVSEAVIPDVVPIPRSRGVEDLHEAISVSAATGFRSPVGIVLLLLIVYLAVGGSIFLKKKYGQTKPRADNQNAKSPAPSALALDSSMASTSATDRRANPRDKAGRRKRFGIITPRRDTPATAPRVKRPASTSGPTVLSPQKPNVAIGTSMRLQPGDQIEKYVLTRQMDRDEKIPNIETWLANDGSTGDFILKVYWVSVNDDYGGKTDLGDFVSGLLPGLEKLITMQHISGVAPWVGYHYREQDRRLVMCRHAYPDLLLDRFSAGSGPYPDAVLLEVLRQIAEAIDTLTTLRQFASPPLRVKVSTNNLLMQGTLAFITDFDFGALSTLREQISNEYGPRLIVRRTSWFCLPELYYFLRTGMKPRMLRTAGTQTNEATTICLDGLIDEAERDLVACAMTSRPPDLSCRQFIEQLAPLLHRKPV